MFLLNIFLILGLPLGALLSIYLVLKPYFKARKSNFNDVAKARPKEASNRPLNLNFNSTEELLIMNKNSQKLKISSLRKISLDNSNSNAYLGCFYETSDGKKGVINNLSTQLGDYFLSPQIYLDVKRNESEILFFNPESLTSLKRVLIYFYIKPDISLDDRLNSSVSLNIQGNGLNTSMDFPFPSSKRYVVSCALIEEKNGVYTMTRLGKEFKNQSHMDMLYEWGMKWNSSKRETFHNLSQLEVSRSKKSS